MATIELLQIDLDVMLGGTMAASLRFRITPDDAKTPIDRFEVEVTVPRSGGLEDTVDRGFLAIHRLAQSIEEKLRPGSD
jgi:hypothetical protein